MSNGKSKPARKHLRPSRLRDITPPDQAERDAIITRLDTSMLVEASAGAGKTRSLVDRMIALLREGHCSVESLAAITFTRKAAAELRARFQVALERAAAEEHAEPYRSRLQEALLHVERLFVGTIHSFCGRLLRERPIEAGIDPAFVELDEVSDAHLRRRAWQDFVSDMLLRNDPLLERLESFGLRLHDLEDSYSTFVDFPDVDEWPTDNATPPDIDAARCEFEHFREQIEDVAAELPDDGGNDKLIPKYKLMVRLGRQPDLSRPAVLLELFKEFENAESLQVVQRNWPGKKEQACRAKEQWTSFARRVAVPCLEQWRRARYPVVLEVLQRASGYHRERRRAAGGLNFQDLLMQAATVLRTQPLVRAYFRRRFSHLLVDEFQDTDPVQAEVMLLLTADDDREQDWRRARPVPGSLFVVGDPKQSIYRFRRADIVTYNDVRAIIQKHGEVIGLSANFRSSRPLIEWVNNAFARLLPATASAYSPAHVRMHGLHEPADPRMPSTRVLQIPAGAKVNDDIVRHDSHAIAQIIAAQIEAGAAEPGDFLILCRRKRHLKIYARELNLRGIPCEVTGGSVLGSSVELRLLYQCLKALCNSDDALALVGVLRGPLFGISDQDLYQFSAAGGRFTFTSEVPETLRGEGPESLRAAFRRLKSYRSWLRRLPLMAAVERIAADLGLAARAAAAAGGNTSAGILCGGLELLRSASLAAPSLSELVRVLQELIETDQPYHSVAAATSPCDPVRIMNLHQAKGLEAPVVFLADPTGNYEHPPKLHIDRQQNAIRGYLCPHVQRGKSSELLALPPNWERHCAEETEFQRAEELRLLYVAATRAMSQLVISRRSSSEHRSPWCQLDLDLDAQAVVDIPTTSRAAAPGAPLSAQEAVRALPAPAARWAAAARPSYDVVSAKRPASSVPQLEPAAAEAGTEWGSLVHGLLEMAMRQSGSDLHHAAASMATVLDLPPQVAQHAVEVALRVTQSSIWKRAQASRQCLVEVPFRHWRTAADGELPSMLRGVIDLVFREGDGWIVVDYKTDRRSPDELPALIDHYRPQLENYSRFWQHQVREPVVEACLYFVHLDRLVQVG